MGLPCATDPSNHARQYCSTDHPAFCIAVWAKNDIRRAARYRALPDRSAGRHTDTRFHMLKMYVGNLSPDTREADVQALFSQHGKVRSIRLAADVFSGQCRGFGFVEMEGHEARAAIAALNGKEFMGKQIKVNEEKPRDKNGPGGRGR